MSCSQRSLPVEALHVLNAAAVQLTGLAAWTGLKQRKSLHSAWSVRCELLAEASVYGDWFGTAARFCDHVALRASRQPVQASLPGIGTLLNRCWLYMQRHTNAESTKLIEEIEQFYAHVLNGLSQQPASQGAAPQQIGSIPSRSADLSQPRQALAHVLKQCGVVPAARWASHVPLCPTVPGALSSSDQVDHQDENAARAANSSNEVAGAQEAVDALTKSVRHSLAATVPATSPFAVHAAKWNQVDPSDRHVHSLQTMLQTQTAFYLSSSPDAAWATVMRTISFPLASDQV